MASTLVNPEVQVAFNLKKGSLPMRPDVDLSAANDCMKKGLEILDHSKAVFPNDVQMIDRDSLNQINDLLHQLLLQAGHDSRKMRRRSSLKSSRARRRCNLGESPNGSGGGCSAGIFHSAC